MPEIKILVEGYAKPTGGQSFKASPSSVLIKDSGKMILVDPGANKEKLIEGLNNEGIGLGDIDIIFITHYHIDHILNIRLFPESDILDGYTVYRNDEEIEYDKKIPGTTVRIIPTPGHAHEHVSLLVDTKDGKVCVAGDLWWWKDMDIQNTDQKSLLRLKDPFVKDRRALLASRKKILKMADFIIPGHGKMFRVHS